MSHVDFVKYLHNVPLGADSMNLDTIWKTKMYFKKMISLHFQDIPCILQGKRIEST